MAMTWTKGAVGHMPVAVLASACLIAGCAVVEPEPAWESVSVGAGQELALQLETPLASNSSQVGDVVRGVTGEPISVGGAEVIPAGSQIVGRVTQVEASGKVEGRAQLAVQFDEITVHGDRYGLATAPLRFQAEGTTRDDAVKIGLGAGIGAVIGGLAGGGDGAAIGSAIGGGAGTAVVLSTPGEEVVLPSGQRLTVELLESVTIEVPVTADDE